MNRHHVHAAERGVAFVHDLAAPQSSNHLGTRHFRRDLIVRRAIRDELNILLFRQETQHSIVDGFEVHAMLRSVVKPSAHNLGETGMSH